MSHILHGDGRGDYSLTNNPSSDAGVRSSNQIDTGYHGSAEKHIMRKPVSKSDHVTYVSAVDPDNYVEKPGRRRQSSRLSRISSYLSKNPVSSFRTPTFAAPWQHDKVDHGHEHNASSERSTVRYFRRRNQWRRIFMYGFIRWWITIAVCAIMCGTLLAFSGTYRPTLHKWEKYSFNMLITVESLFLGIVVVAALKQYCDVLTWRFLAAKYRDLQEFELVLDCSSLMSVWKLLVVGRTPNKIRINGTQIMCLMALIVFLGLQLLIGAIGLTYSIDPTPGQFHFKPGNVTRGDLSNIRQDYTNNTNIAAITGSANFYGIVGQSYWPQYNIPLGQGQFGLAVTYTSDNNTWFYNFVDQAPYDPQAQTVIGASSSRYVTANATCAKLNLTEDGFLGTNLSSKYMVYEENGKSWNWTIPALTTTTTTYAANYLNNTCGPRCTKMYIIDTGINADPSINQTAVRSQMFVCNSTVSEVYNINTCSQPYNCSISDDNAYYLAGAIGYAGATTDNDAYQYKNYPPGSPYSWDANYNDWFTNATNRQATIAQFSIQAVAAMDGSLFQIVMPGQVPKIASVLDVNWQQTFIVLAIVAGLQLFFLFIVCIYANGALIKDGGPLAIARLLRPVVDQIGQHGCALTGDELSEALGNFKVIYGVREMHHTDGNETDNSGAVPAQWHAGIINESEGYGRTAAEGHDPKARFPEGSYDGLGYYS